MFFRGWEKGGFCQTCFLIRKKKRKRYRFLTISEKGTFGAHNCFGHFVILGVFKKPQNTTKISKIVNFGKFRKLHPPFQKTGLLEWV